MTGLALLAMLAAGNTHQRGQYQENVRRGLNFLLQCQDAEGCLSGTADRYAAMYCHAIATFALGEDYGMTGERRLEQPLRRAIAYTIAAQDPYGGGWRYQPRDAGGDTSQLGWQFMALKSAALAGIPTPEATRQGIVRYLQSVASRHTAGWHPTGRRKPPSRTMTAEAMLCWQFLGLSGEHPACDEAAGYLLSAPPGIGPAEFLLLVLWHARHVSIPGRRLAALEHGGCHAVGRSAKQGRPAGRFLGPRFRLGRLWRADLQHGLGSDVPGGLLPLFAGVSEITREHACASL